MKKWYWRDLLCFLKLKFSRNGYAVREMSGIVDGHFEPNRT